MQDRGVALPSSLKHDQEAASEVFLAPATLDKAWRQNGAIYDFQNGGFGGAPDSRPWCATLVPSFGA
ncbi:MAG: hypothetical protein ABSH24_28965 [Bryobacteraceae bacterium]|jgi:hypothetical protein